MTREEAIRILVSSCIPGSKQTEALETLIPELKESENERIRKEIIDFIQWSVDRHFMREDFHQAKRPAVWIAYLEKQKEQKQVDYEAELKKCKDNPLYFYDKYVSIKQKPAEWSEEDEKIRHCIGLILTDAPEKRFKDYNLNLKECLVWLGNKTTNSSILPNKNDEKMLNRIIGHLSGFIYPNSLYCDDAKECIAWLKSLRLQKLDASKLENFDPVDVLNRIKKEWPMAWEKVVWKPSEEQMNVLRKLFIEGINALTQTDCNTLNSIYLDFKKLM